MLDARKEEPSMDNSLYTFNITVHGYRHIQESIPCQDYSSKYSGMQGENHNESADWGTNESIIMREPISHLESDESNTADGCGFGQQGIESSEVIEHEVLQSDYSAVATEIKEGYEGECFHIVTVADGHGDPACHRSGQGSRFAVEVGLQCLKGFAGAIIREEMPFEHPRQRSECMQQLTSSIIAKWHEEVLTDLEKNPITEEDLADAGSYAEKYRTGIRLDHLYGTTLIAALYVKDFLILIQQGDGRCDVFYQDGTIDQPIPWDARCKGSTTTSMCDEDAISSIRSKVIDLKEEDVVACFIGSDGVEDSYYDNEQEQLGTHRFYMDLVCQMHGRGTDDFESYLNHMLPEFSKRGSADDVSIAGMVDLDKTKSLLDEYRSRVERYDRREILRIHLVEANSKVISMTRKHGILKEDIVETEKALANARTRNKHLLNSYNEMEMKYKSLERRYIRANKELEEYERQSRKITVEFRVDRQMMSLPIVLSETQKNIDATRRFLRHVFGRNKEKRKSNICYLSEQLQLLTQKIKKNEEDQKTLKEIIADLENELERTKKAFVDYDNEYRKTKSDVELYAAELASLEGDD